MLLAIAAVIGGLILLVWSADKFVDGAAGTAAHAGMPPLLIGMLIVGFGTSAPEMVVSALAAMEGNPSLALGNAYGSNISNIALILGVVAVISPIAINSAILRKELPVLTVITLLAGYQLLDGHISRVDAWILIGLLAALMGWSVYAAMSGKGDVLGGEVETELAEHPLPLKMALTLRANVASQAVDDCVKRLAMMAGKVRMDWAKMSGIMPAVLTRRGR